MNYRILQRRNRSTFSTVIYYPSASRVLLASYELTHAANKFAMFLAKFIMFLSEIDLTDNVSLEIQQD